MPTHRHRHRTLTHIRARPAGEIVKAKRNMRIAYLAQEFDVDSSRTVREEFYSVYQQQVQVGPGPGWAGCGLRAVGCASVWALALLALLALLCVPSALGTAPEPG